MSLGGGEALIFAVAGTVAYVRRRAIAAYVTSAGPGPFRRPLTYERHERGIVVAAIACWAIALAFLIDSLI